jgi:hypothetical protein
MEDQATLPPPSNGSTTVQSLEQVTDKVRAKHGWGGKRAGAGGKNKNNAGNGKGVGSSPRNDQAPPPEVPPIDLEFVKQTIASLLKVGDAVMERRTVATVRAITRGDEAIARAFGDEIKMSEDEIAMVSSTAALVFQKYQLLARYMPECILGVWFVSYGTRVMMTKHKVQELAAYVARERGMKPQEESANANPSSPH